MCSVYQHAMYSFSFSILFSIFHPFAIHFTFLFQTLIVINYVVTGMSHPDFGATLGHCWVKKVPCSDFKALLLKMQCC